MLSKLQRPAKKFEIIGAIFFGIALSFLLYAGQYVPKSKEMIRMQTEIDTVNKEAQALEEFNAKVRETRDKQLQEMTSQVKKNTHDDPRLQLIRKSRAPEFRLFEDFMRKIMNPGFRPSVDVESLTYSTSIEYGGFSETEFSFSASGPYVNVMAFMSRLEKLPALLTIKDFDLKVGKTDNAFVTVSVKASFYQLDDDNV